MARDQARRKGTCPGSPASRPAAVAPATTPAAFRCAIRPQRQGSGRSPLGPFRPVRTSRKHSCRTSRSFPGLRGLRSLRIPKSVPPLGPGCCDDHRIRSAPAGLRRRPRSRTTLTDCADASGPRLSDLARCTCRGSTGRPWTAVAPCATSCRARGPESGPGPPPARLSGIAGCSVVSASRFARSHLSRSGQHGSRHTPSSGFFRMDDSLSSRDSAQNSPVGSAYSTWKTALPASMNGVSSAHSPYCAHSSLTAKSKSSTRRGICGRSF
ncbi:hypothetical protein SHIRM173S_00427 [Streptomyces hirsutus]